MAIRAVYRQAMERLYLACIVIAGTAMIVMTLVIPYGVFMRYAMNSAASWPEPLAIVLMVLFSFLGGAAAYRAHAHIAVETFVNMLGERGKAVSLKLAELGMALMALFMLVYGARLVHETWHNTIAEFPALSVGITYSPLPLAGLVTALFIIERLWLGSPPPDSITYQDQPQTD